MAINKGQSLHTVIHNLKHDSCHASIVVNFIIEKETVKSEEEDQAIKVPVTQG